jgi:HD-GYP domain-containing protein (c-di-GMP phosphodiesterase class II)
MEPNELSVDVGAPDETVVLAAQRFVLALYEGFRAVRHHRPESQPWRDALDELSKATDSIVGDQGGLELRVVHRSLFVNRIKLKREISNFAAFGHVVGILLRTGAGVLRVEGSPSRREWQGLLKQVLGFVGEKHGPDRISKLQKILSTGGLQHFSVGPQLVGESDFPDEVERRRAARATYQHSVAVSKELFQGARMGRSTDIKQIKHAVQGIVDQVLHNPTSLGGLSTLKDYDDYSFTHSVNVCIFCVAIGRRLGLSKPQLYDLGLAALVHDLGMSRIPVEILTKGSRLSPAEEAQMQAHTWLGALSIYSLRDYGGVPYQSMIVAFEHHLKTDLSGYPHIVRPRRPSVFSKIIAVASAFDAATNTRSYSVARPPDEVLRELWEDKTLGLDPVIVKALINLLGIYPVGTCVVLDTLELALVHEANSDLSFVHRPIVRVLSGADGVWLDDPPLFDLADPAEDGTFLRSIIKVTDPARYGISVSDYFA